MKKDQKKPTGLKFKKGDRVEYVIAGQVQFLATVEAAEVKKGYKPYTLKTDEGRTTYAHEKFLRSAK
jgi:hypothetical protein